MQYDKIQHFGVGFVLGFVLPHPWGFAAATTAGIGKEIWDLKTQRGRAEHWDYIATIAGGAAGAVVRWLAMPNL